MTKRAKKTGKELERRVAKAYREMRARKVEHDVELAGNQIDVYVELETPGRLLHRIAVEVKDWSKPVGIDIVNGFAHIAGLLRQKQLIDEGIIVSTRGFSKQARNAAKVYGIRLLEPADLNAMVAEVKRARGEATSRAPERAAGEETAVLDLKTKPNPFIYGRPVQPDEFVDRREELQLVLSRIHNGESTAVVGEPRIGKSSLLLKLRNELQQSNSDDESRRLVVSFLDLQGISSEYSPVTFWNKVLDPLRQGDGRESIARQLERVAQAGYVREYLEDLFNCLRREGLRVVLLLDEFEQLPSHPNFQDFSFFTTFHTSTPSICFVVASRLTLKELNSFIYELPGMAGSPPLGTLVEERLLPFDKQATDTLLSRAGDALSPHDRRLVHRVAGGHPFLIQALAAALIQTTGENRYIRACERFYEWVSHHFEELWKRLGDHARVVAMLLSLVALQGGDLGRRFDHNKIQQPNAFSSELEGLRKLRLARPVGADWPFDTRRLFLWQGHGWTIESPAFALWIREKVIGEIRASPHSEWRASQFYHSLLTRQWDWLASAMRNVSEQPHGVLIQAIVNELVGENEE